MKQAQMLILPGSWVPDAGYALLGTPRMRDAIQELLARGGLILGLGEGFGTLLRLGLLPGILAPNAAGRHVSRYVDVTAESVKSPWMSMCNPGTAYALPLCTAHGRYEGDGIAASRFIGGGAEGVVSADGRILGKITRPDRWSPGVAINVPGEKHMPVFEGGVGYFL
jgi:phosphoribosylformylglycinamidine synthase